MNAFWRDSNKYLLESRQKAILKTYVFKFKKQI